MGNKLSSFKNFIFGIITFFMVILIILTINEIAFRIVRGAPNPLFSITQIKTNSLFEPNTVLENQTNQFNEFNYTAHINHHGYRGKDFAHPKPEGIKRVMVIGDSFTFGVGAEDYETIPAYIEEQIKKKYPQTEVINAGIGHASPIYHYLNLKNFHLKYEPDVVVLMLDLTDIQDDWRQERQAVYNKEGNITHFDHTYLDGRRSWWKWLTFYCASWAQFDKKVLRSYEKKSIIGRKKYRELRKQGIRAKAYVVNMEEGSIPDDVLLRFDGLLFLRGQMRERLIRQQFERTAKYLDKIQVFLAERNIPLVLATYPYGIYVGEDQWNEGRHTWGFEKDKLYTDYLPFEIIGDYARSRGIPFINATPVLTKEHKQSGVSFYYSWDGHMTPAANEIVAKTISSDPQFLNLLN